MVAGVAQPTGKPAEHEGPRPYRPAKQPRQPPTLLIQGAQRLGLRLDDIRELLAVRDTGTCPCEPADQLLRRRLAQLDAELARLVAPRQDMAEMLQALAGADCPPPAPGTWCPSPLLTATYCADDDVRFVRKECG